MAETCEFLRHDASPGSRFMATKREREVSYLSDVWSIPLGRRRLSARPYQSEDFDAWVEQGVTHVVLFPGLMRSYYRDVLSPDFLEQNGFRKVFDNKYSQIYRLKASQHESNIADDQSDQRSAI